MHGTQYCLRELMLHMRNSCCNFEAPKLLVLSNKFHYKSYLNLSLIMAAKGASLQNFNNELVKCIEDLREKREEINRQLLKDEEDKAKIQQDLSALTDRLAKINESLARKVTARNEYDRTIQETEGAYMKILESSATLLQVLKRETVSLVKKK